MNLINQIGALSAFSLRTNLPEIDAIANESKELIPSKLVHSADFLDLDGSGLPANAHQLCPRSRSPDHSVGQSPISAGDLQARIAKQAEGNKEATGLPPICVPLQPAAGNASADAASETDGQEDTEAAEVDAVNEHNGAQNGTVTPDSTGAGDLPAEGNPAAANGDAGPSETVNPDATANDGAQPAEAPAGPNESAAPGTPAGTGNEAPAPSPNGQAGTISNAEGEVAPANGAPSQPPVLADAPNPEAAPGPIGIGGFENGPGAPVPPLGTSPMTPGVASHPILPPAAAFPPIDGTGTPATAAVEIATVVNLPSPQDLTAVFGGVGIMPMTPVGAAGQSAPLQGGNAAIAGIVGEKIAPFEGLAGAFGKLSALPAAIQNALKALLLSLLARLPVPVLADPAKSKDAFDQILQAVAGLVQKILGRNGPENPASANPNRGNLAKDNAAGPALGQNAQDANWQQKLNPEAKDIQWAAPFGQHEWKENVLHIKGGKYRGCRGYYDQKSRKLRVFTEAGKHVANQHVKHEKHGRPRISSPLAEAHAS